MMLYIKFKENKEFDLNFTILNNSLALTEDFKRFEKTLIQTKIMKKPIVHYNCTEFSNSNTQ